MERLIRVKYCKNGPIKYISHLNLTQVFTRALRRADIPMVISGGFNPRFRMSFGPPLPLGISSTSEYLDIRVKKKIEPEDLIYRLNVVLPCGLKVLQAKIIPLPSDSLVKIISSAFYIITLKLKKSVINLSKEDLDQNKENLNREILREEKVDRELKDLKKEIDKNIKGFLNQEEIVIEKQTKKGIKKINTRPAIINMSVKKCQDQILEINLWLNIGQEGNLNPRYVVEAWLSNSGYIFDIKQICRDGLYIKNQEVIDY
ncbi:MAG: TIGR03936 family radical SAM-associated protein [Candidatus Atribacteria bacterium]|nr:TIGR03936 family radical SAM-associated protein [Candidatus Atribacteria bacterium]